MTQPATDIDFARRPQRLQISGWPLLAAATVAATAVALWSIQARSDIESLDRQLGSLNARQAQGRPPAADAQLESDIRAANDALDLIGIPWDRLFRAVEAASLDGVRLVGLFPDARTGTVQIRAATDDAELMFQYARRLAEQPALSSVFLVEHQLGAAPAQQSLQFVMSASWMGKAP